MVTKIRKRANIEALINSKLGLKKFATNLVVSQDETNMYLSSKIHDEISQVLAALKIEVGLIQKDFCSETENFVNSQMNQRLSSALTAIDSCLKNSIEVGAHAWPELLDILGLIPSLNHLSLKFIKQNAIACQFVTLLDNVEFDREKLISIYKIADAALENISKHAQATEVMIYFEKNEDKYQLRIVDNGIGFNTRVNNDTKWFGFIEMKQRAAMIHAELNIFSLKNKGTELVLSF